MIRSGCILVLYLFILFFAFRCKNTEFPYDSTPLNNLLLSDSFHLPLSAAQYFRLPCDYFYSRKGREYYSFAQDNQIFIYDLNALGLYKTISFDEEGDNGIGKLFGYAIYSEDTILVTSHSSNKIFMTTGSGKIIKVLPLKGEIPFFITNNQSALIDEKYLFFSNPGYITNQSRPFSMINLNNKQIDTLNIPIPSKLMERPVNPYFFFPNIAVNHSTQKIHILFPSSDSLITFHLKNTTSEVQKINALKNYSQEWSEEKNFHHYSSSIENLKHSISIPKIKRFFHDPYRRLFIVSLSVPEPFQNSDQLIDRDIIQIYDEQFNLLQENKLDYNYLLKNAFINKKGLNVNHFMYDDHIEFHTFTYPGTLKLSGELKNIILNSRKQNHVVVPSLGCANCIEEAIRQINDSSSPDTEYIVSRKLSDQVNSASNVIFIEPDWIDLIIPNPLVIQSGNGVIKNYYYLIHD